MRVLLDTNFILSCTKQKIDFEDLAEHIFDEKIEWIVPREVLEELEKISKRKGERTRDKESAKISMEIISHLNPLIIELNSKNVDDGIVSYLNKNPCVLATLDKELKKRTSCRILTIRLKKYLELL